MENFNVSTIGLRGRNHAALSNLITRKDVQLSRPHLKLLAGNYLTYEVKAKQSVGTPWCRICGSEIIESVCHIITSCQGMLVERERVFQEFKLLCSLTKNRLDFDKILQTKEELCQFILDPTSLNLNNRISLNDPILPEVLKLSRDFC